MSPLAVLLIGLFGWLLWTGRLQRMTAKDGVAIGIAVLGVVLTIKGKPLAGFPALLAAAGYAAFRKRPAAGLRKAGERGTERPDSATDDAVAEASALLGLARDADATAIRAAHRRLIAAVHPDRGGTEALAARINAARDLLLRRQEHIEGSRHGVNAHFRDQGQDDS